MRLRLFGLLVLVAVTALFGWLVWRSWRARKAWLKWVGLILSGLLFLVLHYYCARQWVEGKPLAACLAISAAACLALGGWSWHSAQRTQASLALYTQQRHLCAKLDVLGKDVQVYDVGISPPLLIFYLDIPVKTEQDLAAEPAGKTGTDAPRRALVLRRKDLPMVERDYGPSLNLGEDVRSGSDPILVLDLPREHDWPAQIAPALKTRHSKH